MATLLAAVKDQQGVHVTTSDTLDTVVNAQAAGAVIILDAGVHRLATCTPKSGQVIIASPGAVMNGSDLLSTWTLDTGKWRHDVTEGLGNNGGTCLAGVLCVGPEDLFRDNVRLTPVASLGAVVTGTVWIDTALHRVWVSDDPNGHVMEWSRLTRAVVLSNPGVILRNLVIEKYAPGAQFGAVHGSGGGTGTRMFDCEVRYCHGILHEVSWDAKIRNNIVRRCGLVAPLDAWIGGLGIAVSASPDVEVSGNTVEDCASGIGFIQQNRGNGAYGPRSGEIHFVSNFNAHDNLVKRIGTMGAGVHTYAGGVQDYFTPGSCFTGGFNNTYTNNDYVGCTGGAFKWNNADRTFAVWQGTYNLDLTGSFT
jgi:hypothetical protein